MANLISQIAEMLGVEIGEKFKVKGREHIFRFADNGLIAYRTDGSVLPSENCLTHFLWLINGEEEIVKLPWKPKNGEKYWTFYFNDEDALDADWSVWHEDVDDFARLKAGWVYRTEEEAKVELSKVAAEMGVDYEL